MQEPAEKLDRRTHRRRLQDSLYVLIVPRKAVQRLSDADFEVTCQRQPDLSKADPKVLAEHRQQNFEVCEYRVRRLRSVHGRALLLVVSAIAAGVIVTIQTGTLPTSAKLWLGVGSVGTFAWATLARLGWAGQSIKGDTAIERIDDTWFRALYWVATFAATLSLR